MLRSCRVPTCWLIFLMHQAVATFSLCPAVLCQPHSFQWLMASTLMFSQEFRFREALPHWCSDCSQSPWGPFPPSLFLRAKVIVPQSNWFVCTCSKCTSTIHFFNEIILLMPDNKCLSSLLDCKRPGKGPIQLLDIAQYISFNLW